MGKMILKVIATSNSLDVKAIAPRTLHSLKISGLESDKLRRSGYYISIAIKRLAKRNFIKIIKNLDGHQYTEITTLGKRVLLKYEIEGLARNKPLKWDGKFRVIIFDIKEEKRKTRDELRRIIENFGFIYLQKSVWIYPYPCENIISLLKANLYIDDELLFMIVDKIDNDTWLKEKFKLD